jgi:hypothetical protein
MVNDRVLEDNLRLPRCMICGIALLIALPLSAEETVLPMTPAAWHSFCSSP